ncbi:2-amino-4-hydroxy-6-hydroxymethyldihydropteridine diphosphokinase [Deinococcus sonorensis]|uniref:2-amino-4-hydroxy-6-hydroxymethyldihydropteridine diphosphokinase n=2 Tax=Deinococcus sonorensis TaxID=309891 RepID=A0AAU7U8Q6_9DEIO
MAEPALIALGANLGDPAAALRWARTELARLGTVQAGSHLYRTRAVGGPPGQPDYLNAALALGTDLDPGALLRALLQTEERYGRVRVERWGPRVLDLDLIGVGGQVIQQAGLTLPHPLAFERGFVLAPLAEVAPGWRHPLSGETVEAALRRVGQAGLERLPERL